MVVQWPSLVFFSKSVLRVFSWGVSFTVFFSVRFSG